MREGWEIKTLGEVCQIKPPKKEAKQRLSGTDLVSFIPMCNLGELQKETTLSEERQLSSVIGSYTYFADNDVLLAKITPCFENGKLGIARNLKNGIGFGSSEYIVFRTLGEIASEYLFYFLSQDTFRDAGTRVMSGAVGHKRVPKDFIETLPIPLPPLAEQKRIVGVLDEAFGAIGVAVANAQKNLANARELFETTLNNIFTQKGESWVEKTLKEVSLDFGRGKSKHRPRNAPELYGGTYPFIQTGDVRNSDHYILESKQTYSEAGLAQSKLWPRGTICITIAANIAETGILEFDACFPDSIIGIVVDEKLTTNGYVEYALQSVKARIKARGQGSAQDNINLATFESEYFPFPNLSEQKEILAKLDNLSANTQRLEAIYRQKLDDLAELKQSILQKAFAGELTAVNVLAFPKTSRADEPVDTTSPAFNASVICFARHLHAKQKRDKTFGRVKAEKTRHLTESIGRISLGRKEYKGRHGPNDSAHMRRAEKWAKEQQFFEFVKRPEGKRGYDFIKLARYDEMKTKAFTMIKPYRDRLEKIINLLIPMDTEQAEVFATVHAAWNNLIIDGVEITDDAIIHEATENWHPEKLNILISKFKTALREIRQKNLIPDGTAKYVGKQQGDMF